MKDKKPVRLWLFESIWATAILLLWLISGAVNPQLVDRLTEQYEALVRELPLLDFSSVKRIVAEAWASFAPLQR